ncbi:hypothetical protein NJ959_16765 [Symplocastrum sp. BBK-W-15]|uniref:Uncharacterized protein n=1 Tax=Limnofasciculus baicalensis BBK-W-15 TaxID=2699891 RepID=A0AAE3GSR5_9CYAN|nr:hypothetical protein [Limnofasciculus baicalensis BBK-W-15]
MLPLKPEAANPDELFQEKLENLMIGRIHKWVVDNRQKNFPISFLPPPTLPFLHKEGIPSTRKLVELSPYQPCITHCISDTWDYKGKIKFLCSRCTPDVPILYQPSLNQGSNL